MIFEATNKKRIISCQEFYMIEHLLGNIRDPKWREMIERERDRERYREKGRQSGKRNIINDMLAPVFCTTNSIELFGEEKLMQSYAPKVYPFIRSNNHVVHVYRYLGMQCNA